MRTLKRIVLAAAAVAAATSAQAETNWDLPLAWQPGNLHAEKAQAYAQAEKEGTHGELVITLHHGGPYVVKWQQLLPPCQSWRRPIDDSRQTQQVHNTPTHSCAHKPD